MTNKRTEQVRELLNNPRSGLKDSSDTNKTRMEILAIVSDLEDELVSVNKRTDEEIIEDATDDILHDAESYVADPANKNWFEGRVQSAIRHALKEARADEREKHKETMVCSAVMASDGSIYRGHRHSHAMQAVRDEGKELINDKRQQGFITTQNRYVSREEARTLQETAGIPSADKNGYRGNTLFSEDLYQANNDVIINNK